MNLCTVEGCTAECRNGTSPYCEKHYSRWKRHGDPNVVLKDHTPPEERWKTSYVVDEDTGCWNWTGTKSRGYGVISCGANNNRPAHVFVYEQVVGPVPDGMELDHVCRNKGCVNPDLKHLEPVTHLVNVRRGEAGIANSSKTKCKWGHEFTPANTVYNKRGQRNCAACTRRLQREAMRKRRLK